MPRRVNQIFSHDDYDDDENYDENGTECDSNYK
jgi:hypothetical protein